jgi:hypothetical protein
LRGRDEHAKENRADNRGLNDALTEEHA